jgi:PAS domain S-box-containing protein
MISRRVKVRPALDAKKIFAQPERNSRHSYWKPSLRYGWASYAAQLVTLAAAYFCAAKLGLTMAFVAEQVSVVWPPTGIALAALLLYGYRLWPGIALGAFLANATANEPITTGAGIAIGNTLEALVGAWLLRTLAKFDPALGRVRDVLNLVVLAAGVSTMLGATVGAASLCLAGVKPWTSYPAMWSVWWLGDALGNLVVAPLLLTWAGWRGAPWRARRVAEAGALLLGLMGVSLLVFAGPRGLLSFYPLAYAVFPLVIWSALRFGQPAATLITFVASSLAIWGTVAGYGPFAPTTHESLILAQIFMGVVAVTALVLGAVTVERERAKEAARQSRDELRLTLEASRVGTWNWDQHTGKVCWSDNLEAIHGLAPGTFGGTFEAFLNCVHPEDRDTVLQAIRSATGKVKDYEIEYRSICADGGFRWMGGRGRMLYDAAGHPLGMHGICADITPRKQAEASLQQSYDLLRAVIEGTTDAVFVKDRQGRYLMINTAGARFLGKTVAEVIGKDDTVLFSSETARSIMEGDRRIMATGVVQTYEDVGTAVGVTRTYLTTKAPYRDAQGNVIGVLGVSRDISERKRAEERFRLVVDSAPSGMLMIDREGRIILVNAQTEKMFGYDRGELLGQPVEVLVPDRFRGGHPAYRAGFFANPTARAMGAGRQLYGQRRDRSEFPVEIGLTPIEMAEGLFVLSAIVDISERKRAEEAERIVQSRDSEFRLARAIQQGLLPKAPPILPDLEIAAASHPTQETGGDYFDFIPMSDGHWGIVIGDASGHGIGAALLIAETRAYLRALALTDMDPGQILDNVNQRLFEDVAAEHFVTLFFGRFDPLTRSLVYSNAGHLSAYILGRQGAVRAILESTGLPLGTVAAGFFVDSPCANLEPGDLLLLLTDGVTEARTAGCSLFGVERTLKVVRDHRHEPAREIVAAVLRQARKWSGAIQADDMTAIVIKVGG